MTYKLSSIMANVIDCCKYCQTEFPGRADFLKEAAFVEIAGDEAISLYPVCESCFMRYLAVRKKYNDDHNINSICMWIKFRECDESLVKFDDYLKYFHFSLGDLKEVFIQLPKVEAGGYRIPTGLMFDRLDSLLKKVPVLT